MRRMIYLIRGVELYEIYLLSPPRKYQIEGIWCVKHNRKVIDKSHCSGKSLMIYSLVKDYVDQGQSLLVVPTTSLVEQMYKDFQVMVGMLTHIATVSILVKRKIMMLR